MNESHSLQMRKHILISLQVNTNGVHICYILQKNTSNFHLPKKRHGNLISHITQILLPIVLKVLLGLNQI